MKTEIPHVNTIENLEERLLVKQGAGIPMQFYSFVALTGILLFYLLANGADLLAFYANFSLRDLLHPYAYLVPIVVFIAAALSFKVYLVWSSSIPANFRVQRQSILPEALLAGTITIALLTATLLFALLSLALCFSITGWELFTLLEVVTLLGVTTILGWETIREFEVLKHYATVYWRHVRVTATFDRAAYRLGESLHIQVQDRLSENSSLPYRVHLNHVEEKIVYTAGTRDAENKFKRHPTYNFFMDLSGADLHRGISLSLPKNALTVERITSLKNKRPRYWEVLIEEHGGRFFARFLVNATL